MQCISQCLLVVVVCLVVALTSAKPVKRGPPPPQPIEEGSPDDKSTGLAYDSYLKQVVEVLESDAGFRKKLETANISDIKSGKIAMYLEMVNHTIRTTLDEVKRREITRLQDLARLQLQGISGTEVIMNAIYGDPRGLRNFEIPSHLDIKNPHSFEMKDLENLIKKTTSDLEELDKKRREEFKEYEMEKEFEKKEHLKELDEQARKKEEERLEELKKNHAEHPKVNHPGSKDQFEEVWDKVDHLEDQEFNPRTFFFKHDINGDMEWSIDEVDAVLQLELDKVYDSKNSPDEDDPIERQEEMNRMREHVFKEIDKDKNFRITLQEFIDYTGSVGENEKFKEDEGWKTVDEEPVFNEEDYQRFIQEHHAQPGVIQPPQDLHFQPEQHHEQNQQFQQQQQLHQQQQFQQQQFQQQPGQPPAGHQQPGQPPAEHQPPGQPPAGQAPSQQQQVDQKLSEQELQQKILELQNQLNQQKHPPV